VKTITVAAGHGANDPGAVNKSRGVNERDLMTVLRDIVAMKLKAAGHNVRTDGGKLQNWPLAQALGLVPGSSLAMELHTNASDSPLAKGVEIVAPVQLREKSQRMALAIAQVLGTTVRADRGWYDPEKHRRDRGWKSQAAFVRQGGMIVEVFFISNATELQAFQDKTWPLAQVIADEAAA